jgi:hypothetical protein
LETDKGAYMPVGMALAAILATGYDGPLSLEIFAGSLHSSNPEVPDEHAKRGVDSLVRLCDSAAKVERFWGTSASETMAYRLWRGGRTMEVEVPSKL